MAGGPKWYSPADDWPQHPKPWFRTALAHARRSGWWYRSAAGHAHGTVYCQGPEYRSGACKFVVFSTGVGGENAARELERLIRRCPHNEAAVADPVVAASVQMDRVDTLCDAAEALMAEHDRERELKLLLDRAAQLLDEAGRGVAEAEEFLAAAMEVELEAKAAASEAERLLTAAGTDVRSPGQLLDMADETSAGVRSVLAEQAASREVRRLRARVDQARVRIRELRSRLSRR